MKPRKSISRKLKVPDVEGFNWEQFEAAILNLLAKEFGDSKVRIEKMEKDSTTFVIG
jgi:hypothetical protein